MKIFKIILLATLTVIASILTGCVSVERDEPVTTTRSTTTVDTPLTPAASVTRTTTTY